MNPQQFGKKNVRYVTPEQLAAFAHQVVTAVLDDSVDEDARLRAMNKLETFVDQLNQQSPDRDPLSRLRRRRKHKPTREEKSRPQGPVGGVSDHRSAVADADRDSADCSPAYAPNKQQDLI